VPGNARTHSEDQVAQIAAAAGWTEAQKRAYLIADNKLTLNGGWDEDEELLKVELGDLKALDFDLGLIGFADDELEKLSEEADLAGLDEDEPAAVGRAVALVPLH
jgi:hypothetical protein